MYCVAWNKAIQIFDFPRLLLSPFRVAVDKIFDHNFGTKVQCHTEKEMVEKPGLLRLHSMEADGGI